MVLALILFQVPSGSCGQYNSGCNYFSEPFHGAQFRLVQPESTGPFIDDASIEKYEYMTNGSAFKHTNQLHYHGSEPNLNYILFL